MAKTPKSKLRPSYKEKEETPNFNREKSTSINKKQQDRVHEELSNCKH